MDSIIVDISAKIVDLPLKEAFETSQRKAFSSPTVIIELRCANDAFGLGEATPVKYVTGEDPESVVSVIEASRSILIGRRISEYRILSQELKDQAGISGSACNGLETAILDAFCQTVELPLYGLLGGRTGVVESDITIPVTTAAHARDLAVRAREMGFRIFKVKVGTEDREADLERVVSVASVSPESMLVVDANQGLEPQDAVSFIRELTARNVRVIVFEQPVKSEDMHGLRWVSENCGVPVFADESAKSPGDVMELARAGAVHGVNIKLMKSGFMGALDIISICRSAGLRLMIGCMLESRIGIAASLGLALGTGGFVQFDLDSDMLLGDQPVSGGFIRDGAFLRPLDLPGLGCRLARNTH